MATRYHIGAKQLRGEIGAYAKRFDLLEVQSGASGARGLASTVTMRKWRKAVPPHFEFAVVAGPYLARLLPGDPYEADLAALLTAVEALQARTVVLATPMEVTPGRAWRERMRKLLARIPRDATQVAWEPRGVWEIEDAAVAAQEWGVVLVVDPTREPVPAGPVAYARLRGIGETRAYGASALERVVRAIGARREAYVILETEGALAECKRLRGLAQGVPKRAVGGGTRILRPRAAIVRVSDDEQE
jgi:uncharacterized protein YecE (DUF72 family)